MDDNAVDPVNFDLAAGLAREFVRAFEERQARGTHIDGNVLIATCFAIVLGLALGRDPELEEVQTLVNRTSPIVKAIRDRHVH